jgi:hypothetical protein
VASLVDHPFIISTIGADASADAGAAVGWVDDVTPEDPFVHTEHARDVQPPLERVGRPRQRHGDDHHEQQEEEHPRDQREDLQNDREAEAEQDRTVELGRGALLTTAPDRP